MSRELVNHYNELGKNEADKRGIKNYDVRGNTLSYNYDNIRVVINLNTGREACRALNKPVK